jgi:Zn-finger nucleic acid-binding protein
MDCPKCHATMELVRFEDIEVDRCVRCGGLWFDHLEKEELKERPGSEAIDTGPTWRAAIHDAQGKVYCPRDGTLMVRMIDPSQPDFRVESCPMCHGTFRCRRIHRLEAADDRRAPGAPATRPVMSG